MLLDIKNIDVLYDDFQVIWDVSINVKKAEMVALLGPNGSGKSTILNTISNLVQHKNGSIHFDNNLIYHFDELPFNLTNIKLEAKDGTGALVSSFSVESFNLNKIL